MKPNHENKLYKKLQVYHLLVILVFHNRQNAVFLFFNCYNILNWYKNDKALNKSIFSSARLEGQLMVILCYNYSKTFTLYVSKNPVSHFDHFYV